MDPQFIKVLRALMSPANDERRNAESYFQAQLDSNPEGILAILLQSFATIDLDLVLRSFSGILLRRAVETHMDKISDQAVNDFRSKMLTLWSQEHNKIILQRLSHVLAQTSLKKPWSELLPTVIDYAATLQD